jgi:hypothetical protein
MRFAFFIISAVALLHAQGTPPKPTAADYPAHVPLGTVTLAAEYLVHSLPTARATLIAKDYLVVEAAFYGPSMSSLKISPSQFTLRINGRGEPLMTELPGLVAASIKYPGQRPGFTTSAGLGPVAIGSRPPPSQFPGDGNDRPLPTGQVTVIEKEDEDAIEYRVQNASLPEGEKGLPRSGLIYFPYRGRIKSIHSLELFYDGPMGKATLKLLP